MPDTDTNSPPFFPAQAKPVAPETDPSGIDELQPDSNKFGVIFVHSSLDDYGLPASAFRVYCHMARRASGGDGAWPAVGGMARACRLHPDTVRSSLRLLTSLRMLRREPRRGATTLYYLTPASAWRPRMHIDGKPSETDAHPSVSQGSPAKRIQGHPPETDVVEGNPIKGNPTKEIQYPEIPPFDSKVMSKGFNSVREEEIYAAYPKKVAKPNAIRAIRRALDKQGFDFLLERTRLYAQTCNAPVQFIPNPSTWFNQERFNDDPATWRRTVGANGKPPPEIIRPDQFGCGVSKL